MGLLKRTDPIHEHTVRSYGTFLLVLGLIGIIVWASLSFVFFWSDFLGAWITALIVGIVEVILLWGQEMWVKNWTRVDYMRRHYAKTRWAVTFPITCMFLCNACWIIFGFWTWTGFFASGYLMDLCAFAHLIMAIMGGMIRGVANQISGHPPTTHVVVGAAVPPGQETPYGTAAPGVVDAGVPPPPPGQETPYGQAYQQTPYSAAPPPYNPGQAPPPGGYPNQPGYVYPSPTPYGAPGGAPPPPGTYSSPSDMGRM
jgi:hypothetical protein